MYIIDRLGSVSYTHLDVYKRQDRGLTSKKSIRVNVAGCLMVAGCFKFCLGLLASGNDVTFECLFSVTNSVYDIYSSVIYSTTIQI